MDAFPSPYGLKIRFLIFGPEYRCTWLWRGFCFQASYRLPLDLCFSFPFLAQVSSHLFGDGYTHLLLGHFAWLDRVYWELSGPRRRAGSWPRLMDETAKGGNVKGHWTTETRDWFIDRSLLLLDRGVGG